MSLSTVTKAPRWSLVTTNKINGPLGKNVVSHRQFNIILSLYALNNKNTLVTSSAKRDIGIAVEVLINRIVETLASLVITTHRRISLLFLIP